MPYPCKVVLFLMLVGAAFALSRAVMVTPPQLEQGL